MAPNVTSLPIFLIGFMCSGKTTLGRALAQATGRDFIDLDELVEETAGMSVKEIFAAEGEESFRRREQAALVSACKKGSPIIACGGGTPCAPGAMELMNDIGLTVYLKPSNTRLINRLLDGRIKRPLIAHIDNAEEMEKFACAKIAQREKFYTMAKAHFDSSLLETPAEIKTSVETFISQLLSE